MGGSPSLTLKLDSCFQTVGIMMIPHLLPMPSVAQDKTSLIKMHTTEDRILLQQQDHKYESIMRWRWMTKSSQPSCPRDTWLLFPYGATLPRVTVHREISLLRQNFSLRNHNSTCPIPSKRQCKHRYESSHLQLIHWWPQDVFQSVEVDENRHFRWQGQVRSVTDGFRLRTFQHVFSAT